MSIVLLIDYVLLQNITTYPSTQDRLLQEVCIDRSSSQNKKDKTFFFSVIWMIFKLFLSIFDNLLPTSPEANTIFNGLFLQNCIIGINI